MDLGVFSTYDSPTWSDDLRTICDNFDETTCAIYTVMG